MQTVERAIGVSGIDKGEAAGIVAPRIAAGGITATGITATGITGDIGDYISLLKPRVMSLVVFTGFAGLIAAPGTTHPFLAAVAVFAIALASGAAGAINMWYDRDIDAVMRRTQDRPVPAGRIDSSEALAFGVVLSCAAVVLMFLAANLMATLLLLAALLFYVFVYTIWLKRRTPQNIVIGGAAGAFPPAIGWAVVTGDVSLAPVLLFLIVFFWTPPHFWALALCTEDDYAAAGVPMLPNVRGARTTRLQILIYTILLLPLGLAPLAIGVGGWLYGVTAAGLGTAFVVLAVALWRSADLVSARRLFRFSLLHLFGLFAALALDVTLAGVFGNWAS